MGVGSMMMEWGLRMADKMALPVFVESTIDGEKFYQKNGFHLLKHLSLDAPIPNEGPEFEDIRARLMPVRYSVMTRPLGTKASHINGTQFASGTHRATTRMSSEASSSNLQFLNCSFDSCQFKNCSITNGRILNAIETRECD